MHDFFVNGQGILEMIRMHRLYGYHLGHASELSTADLPNVQITDTGRHLSILDGFPDLLHDGGVHLCIKQDLAGFSDEAR
ncbi:hypothetical protein [Xanthomonas perforans]|uniref:hypothetical protein n=1 Tax=Xanthomonas perforans TaxID=442694 RepID=UPI00321A2E40